MKITDKKIENCFKTMEAIREQEDNAFRALEILLEMGSETFYNVLSFCETIASKGNEILDICDQRAEAMEKSNENLINPN